MKNGNMRPGRGAVSNELGGGGNKSFVVLIPDLCSSCAHFRFDKTRPKWEHICGVTLQKPPDHCYECDSYVPSEENDYIDQVIRLITAHAPISHSWHMIGA